MHLHSNLGAFRALIYVKDQHGCDERHMRFPRVSPEAGATGVFALIAPRCNPGEIAGVIDQPPSDIKDLLPATVVMMPNQHALPAHNTKRSAASYAQGPPRNQWQATHR
jgi:hypothetical protein